MTTVQRTFDGRDRRDRITRIARLLGACSSLGLIAACGAQQGEDVAESHASLSAPSASHNPEKSFTAFESGQVRPLALSADGKLLYAANTPDNRLEIFRVEGRRLDPVASVP